MKRAGHRRRAIRMATAAILIALGISGVPHPALAENVSGRSRCAGGPTNYAGVRYTAKKVENYGGQVIFTNPKTYRNVIYNMWNFSNPNKATVYSPWNDTLWWVESNDVVSASSTCRS